MEVLSLIHKTDEQRLQCAIDNFAPYHDASIVNNVYIAYIYSWEIYNKIPDMEDIYEITLQQIINDIQNKWNENYEQNIIDNEINDFYESEESCNLDVTIINILDFLSLSYTNKYYETGIVNNGAQRKLFKEDELVEYKWMI